MFATRPFVRSMFTRLAIAGAIAGITSALPGTYAADAMPDNLSDFMKMKPAEKMHLMDRDKKGYVTKQDFMTFHQRMAEKMFERMDKDHDGKLTEAELEFVESTHSSP